jgi:phage terminase large subunit
MIRWTKMIHLEISPSRFNSVYLKYLLRNQHRYQIYFGGSSSGKSVAIAQRAVLDVFGGKRNYLVVRNVQKTLRQSCFNEIVKQIGEFQLTKYFSVNKSDLVITCTLNKKQILFAGLDDTEKIKSITPQDGVITDIWVEEATECERSAVKQLDKRLRGRSSAKKRITLSFNPILKDHWIFAEYFGIWEDDKQYVESEVLDQSILKTTYKDNRFLAPDDIANLENESDPYYYDVYTLGNWGVLGAVIFKNWRVEDFSAIEHKFPAFRHGVDWGFGTDPFAYGKVHYDKTRRRLYICQEVCSVGLLNREAAGLVKPFTGRDQVVCDSAEPKSIEEFRQLGVNAVGAQKGQGSVEHGVKFLQSLEIIIHPRCQQARNEFTKYKYKQDKNGNVLPIPLDRDNHIIDAIRYALEDAYRERKISVPVGGERKIVTNYTPR